jgi:hypothetical protein
MRGGDIQHLITALNVEVGGGALEVAADAADAVGGLACTPFGYGVQIGLGAAMTFLLPGGAVAKGATAAKSGAISTAVAALFADLLEDRVAGGARAICGQDKDGNITDAAAFGSCMAYGARAAANINAASMGGVEISDSEEMALNSRLEEQERNEFRNKSLTSRLFDLKESRSLASSVLLKGRSAQFDLAGLTTDALAAPVSLVGKFSSFIQPVKAEPISYDWGFPLVSVPTSVVEDPQFEDPFDNARRFAELYKAGRVETDRAMDCFGVSFSMSGIDDRIISRAENDVIIASDAYQRARCNDLSDPNWVRTMLFVLDDAIVTSMDCYEGGAQSCADIGIETDAPLSPVGVAPDGDFRGQDTSAQQCQIGDDAGVGNTPDPNIRIRLCSVNGIIVNVAIERNVQVILEGGQRDDLSFSAVSAYRTREHQARLYQRDPDGAAPPGRSMHEWGLAVDFSCDGGRRGIRRDSDCFRWLKDNQAVHGLQHRASGPWHWSTTGF